MMERKVAALAIILAICLTGCNTGKGDVTPNPESSTADVTSSPESSTTDITTEYKTEQIQITDATDALTRLKEGNKRFVDNQSELINVTGNRREQLLDGQTPYAVVVSCSDSRATPTTVFNAGLGELFDIRIAGNVVDADAMGSIEYGVEHLHAPLLVIMGHEKCGAVTAAYDKLNNGTMVEGNINAIVDKIEPAINESKDLDEAIHDNIDHVMDQVEENEIIKHLVEAGKLKIVKAYYSLDGTVTFEQDK